MFFPQSLHLMKPPYSYRITFSWLTPLISTRTRKLALCCTSDTAAYWPASLIFRAGGRDEDLEKRSFGISGLKNIVLEVNPHAFLSAVSKEKLE